MRLKNSINILKNKLILLLVCLLMLSVPLVSISVSAAGSTLENTVKEVLDEIKVNNTTISEDVAKTVGTRLGSDYTVSISDWYLSRAVGACRDSTGVLFEGYDGFASGIISVTGNN